MARRDTLWNSINGTYIKTIKPTGYDVLINGTDKYLNFNSISGDSGYGFRDNAGTMEFKDEGGAWAPFGTGSGAVDSVNGQTGVVVLDTDDIADTATNRYTNDTDITRLANTSGTNTGDNAVNTLYSGLVTNATHTGDATGATALTLASVAITGKSAVTAVGTDYVLISDTSDSGNLKKALVSDFTAGGSSNWTVSGSDIYRNSKVGVNTNSQAPLFDLQVGEETYTPDTYVAPPTTLNASIVYGSGAYTSSPYSYYAPGVFTYRIYTYKDIGGTIYYSSTYIEQTVQTDDYTYPLTPYHIDLDWAAVSGIDGYKIIVQSSYFFYGSSPYIYPHNFDVGKDILTGTTVYTDDNTWDTDGTVTPAGAAPVTTIAAFTVDEPTGNIIARGTGTFGGNVTTSGDFYNSAGLLTGTRWSKTGTTVYYSGGMVGINTSTTGSTLLGSIPYRLNVNGPINCGDNMEILGDPGQAGITYFLQRENGLGKTYGALMAFYANAANTTAVISLGFEGHYYSSVAWNMNYMSGEKHSERPFTYADAKGAAWFLDNTNGQLRVNSLYSRNLMSGHIPYMGTVGSQSSLTDSATLLYSTATSGAEKITNTELAATTNWTFTTFAITTQTATMTIASPCVVTATAHGLAINDHISFTTTGALPTGVVSGTTYYIISAGFTANTFRIAATLGGAAINTSGSQSGTHTLNKQRASVNSTSASSALTQTSANMVTALVIGETYELSFTIANWTTGGVTPTIAGVTLATTPMEAGTYTYRFTALSTASLVLTVYRGNNSGGTLTAVFSIKDPSLKLVRGTMTNIGIMASTMTLTTLAAAATTFVATSNSMKVTGDGGGNTIATITGGISGQELTLLFVDANVTITDTAAGTADTLDLSAAFTSSANDTITFIHDGNKWFEKSRSIN